MPVLVLVGRDSGGKFSLRRVASCCLSTIITPDVRTAVTAHCRRRTSLAEAATAQAVGGAQIRYDRRRHQRQGSGSGPGPARSGQGPGHRLRAPGFRSGQAQASGQGQVRAQARARVRSGPGLSQVRAQVRVRLRARSGLRPGLRASQGSGPGRNCE
jgi:hypothetical protein